VARLYDRLLLKPCAILGRVAKMLWSGVVLDPSALARSRRGVEQSRSGDRGAPAKEDCYSHDWT
jgi:hypothetical protein